MAVILAAWYIQGNAEAAASVAQRANAARPRQLSTASQGAFFVPVDRADGQIRPTRDRAEVAAGLGGRTRLVGVERAGAAEVVRARAAAVSVRRAAHGP